MQETHLCEHFRNLKFTKSLEAPKEPACRYCMVGLGYIWICLAVRGNAHRKIAGASSAIGIRTSTLRCTSKVPAPNPESKKKKLHHSIFINALTAQIICIDC